MALYEFACTVCGVKQESLMSPGNPVPECCGQGMVRVWSGNLGIKSGPPLWTYRIDEIHKRQADKGERLRFVGPAEVGAT